MKLSKYQLAILQECCKYSLTKLYRDAGLYRLGGYGQSPLVYRWRTFKKLQDEGLLISGIVYETTEKGRELIKQYV